MNSIYNSQLYSDVCMGLGKKNKTLPSKYFYDKLGSQLFDKICLLTEYYLTRTEVSILEKNINIINKYLQNNLSIFEFGAGSLQKIKILLDNLSVENYIPIDISFEFLNYHSELLRSDYSNIKIEPLYADFNKKIDYQKNNFDNYNNKIGFFPGSTIGNFDPSSAKKLLKNFGEFLGINSKLIIGIDMIKDKNILLNAYNDKEGITAKFNLNMLIRINRELKANFDLNYYKHIAIYNDNYNRIEMHIISLKDQIVKIGDKEIYIKENEIIHTENSYKYSEKSFLNLAKSSGYKKINSWNDKDKFFNVLLLGYDP